jgi:DNA-binding response OmpR family regulator
MTHRAATVLIVEDDQNLSFLLKKNLEDEGYNTICAMDGEEGWMKFNEEKIDMCLLDVMMPKQDGFSLAAMIRGKDTKVPILFLTAKTMRMDIYKGFELGADDYITKPFTAKELLFRIKAILKRTFTQPDDKIEDVVYKLGALSFHPTQRQIVYNNEIKKLSTKESELMRIFCESRGNVINRDRLLVEVWGRNDYFVSKSLDVYITRLRKLLRDEPDITIQNYHGIGYKMIVKMPASE